MCNTQNYWVFRLCPSSCNSELPHIYVHMKIRVFWHVVTWWLVHYRAAAGLGELIRKLCRGIQPNSPSSFPRKCWREHWAHLLVSSSPEHDPRKDCKRLQQCIIQMSLKCWSRAQYLFIVLPYQCDRVSPVSNCFLTTITFHITKEIRRLEERAMNLCFAAL